MEQRVARARAGGGHGDSDSGGDDDKKTARVVLLLLCTAWKRQSSVSIWVERCTGRVLS